MKPNKNTGDNFTEEHKEVLDLLGEEKIKALSDIIGRKKLSLIPILNKIQTDKMQKVVEDNSTCAKSLLVYKVKNKVGVSERTAYRFVNRIKSKNSAQN